MKLRTECKAQPRGVLLGLEETFQCLTRIYRRCSYAGTEDDLLQKREFLMNILQISPGRRQTTNSLIIQLMLKSVLEYKADPDPRVTTWTNGEGIWALSANEEGHVTGVVCITYLDDLEKYGLLWLEVLPKYQGQGYGKALLEWARNQVSSELVIKPTEQAYGFYTA